MFPLNQKNHPDMLVLLQRKSEEVLYDTKDGILIFDKASGFTVADATTPEAAQAINALITQRIEDVVVRGSYLFTQMKDCTSYETGQPYYFVVFTDIHASAKPHGVTFKQLDTSYISVICDHYSFRELANESYIKQSLQEGMIGAFHHEELVGFIGIHDTGSIGLLEVFPEYRHKGIAQALLTHMIHYRQKQGFLPYGEVFEDNIVSMKLLRKMQCSIPKDKAYWFHKI